jgi:hypothetical protein
LKSKTIFLLLVSLSILCVPEVRISELYILQ